MTVSQYIKGGIMGIVERKEREKEHRREEIIDAAQKIFFEKGLAAATVDEIAESAELSKGTLYLYYKSKEDMYLGVIMRGMEKLYINFDSISASDDSIILKLIKFGDSYKEYFRSNREYFRMVHFLQTPQFHKQVSEDMRQACSMETKRIWDLLIGLLKRGMEEGKFRPDLNPTEVAIILWSNTTALMQRIDIECAIWKERMNIDLEHVLKVSGRLLFKSILTDKAYAEYLALTHE
jgi:TetR/AcrR family transcriptional regulator